jgi:hypothetical protein
MTPLQIAALPDADAEQAHLIDEIEHPTETEAFQRSACSHCGQPLPEPAT